MDPERRYYFPVTGHDFRLTNVACAILCAQLERTGEITTRRNRIFEAYREHLKDVPGIGFQPRAGWAEPAPWLFCITADNDKYGSSRDDLRQALAAEGIDSRPFFIPLHTLPPFRGSPASNISFRLAATHTTLDSQSANMPTDAMQFPLRHPAFVIRDTQADQTTINRMYSTSFAARAASVMKRLASR